MIANIIASSVVISLVLGLALSLIAVVFDLDDTWVATLGVIALGYVVCWVLVIILICLLNSIWRWW